MLSLLGLAPLLLQAEPATAVICDVSCTDLNGDCETNTTDALSSLKIAVGLGGFCKLKVCDATRDGKVNAVDALALLRRAVGSVEELPCEVPVNPITTTTSST